MELGLRQHGDTLIFIYWHWTDTVNRIAVGAG